MNKGTKQNILTQLDMSSNAYNFITTIYYVSQPRLLSPMFRADVCRFRISFSKHPRTC